MLAWGKYGLAAVATEQLPFREVDTHQAVCAEVVARGKVD